MCIRDSSPTNPSIKVTTQLENKSILLSVKDSGIGIDKPLQRKVFKKFYRVPTGNVHNVKGFGLGLFYVQNICKEHGWQVLLDSIPEKGTEITIAIPTNTSKNFLQNWWTKLRSKQAPSATRNPQLETRN